MNVEPEYELVAIDGKRYMIHRLVAAAFIGPRPKGMIVHHKDHQKRNNRWRNLQYVTPSQNTKMAYADGLIGRTLILTAFSRKRLVEMYESGDYLTADLAKQFGIHKATVLGYIRRAGIPIKWRARKITPNVAARMIQMRKRGATFTQIVAAVGGGITEGGVSHVIKKFGR